MDASDFRLRILEGLGEGNALPLGKGQVIVGRSPEADLGIEDAFIARRHLAIVWNDAIRRHGVLSWGINPVFVNRAPIERNAAEPFWLDSGDVIRVGQTQILYEKIR